MKYFSAEQIIREHPGVRAWILEAPGGARLVLKKGAPLPKGVWRLKGVIE